MKQDKRIVQSRNALISGGRQLLLRDASASLSDTAKFAGVGRATLYRHFTTRESLVLAIFIDSLELLDQEMTALQSTGARGRVALEAMVERLLPNAEHLRFVGIYWDQLATKALSTQEIQAAETAMHDIIIDAQSEGSLRQDLPVFWISATIDSLLFSAWELLQDGSVSHEEAARIVLTTLFQGIATPQA